MRSTIHLVSARDYWPLMLAVERPRRDWWLKANRDGLGARDMSAAARRLRPRLAGGHAAPRRGRGAGRQARRRPASATGCTSCASRRRARGSAAGRTSTRWPRTGSARPRSRRRRGRGRPRGAPLPRRLRARPRSPRSPTGPACPAAAVAPALERLRLRRFAAEDGEELVDLPRAPLPDPETPAPVRLLGTWDAILLAHARRAEILPERIRDASSESACRSRCRPSWSTARSPGTWRYEDGRVDLRRLRAPGPRDAAGAARGGRAHGARCTPTGVSSPPACTASTASSVSASAAACRAGGAAPARSAARRRRGSAGSSARRRRRSRRRARAARGRSSRRGRPRARAGARSARSSIASVRPLNVLPSITKPAPDGSRAPRCRLLSQPRRRPWPHSAASTTRSSVWRGLTFSQPAPRRPAS